MPTGRPTIQFRHQLPRRSIRPTSLRAHSYKTVLISDASDEHPVPRSPVFLPDLAHNTYPLRFTRTDHRTQENTLLAFSGLSHRTQLRNSQMEEPHRARSEGKGYTEFPCPLWVHHPPGTTMCSPTQSFGGFM